MDSILSKPEIINRDLSALCPWFAVKVKDALAQCHEQGLDIAVFESYRSPQRQDFLYASGRSRPGKKITYARAFESFHNYGLAADLAFYNGRAWSWDGPWDKVIAVFHQHGFETLDFEKSHVQITCGMTHQEAYKISKEQGMIALWFIIEGRFNKP